jgi:hypothetical protein
MIGIEADIFEIFTIGVLFTDELVRFVTFVELATFVIFLVFVMFDVFLVLVVVVVAASGFVVGVAAGFAYKFLI